MAQHLLDGVDIRAVFQQVRCKGVAQRMGRNVLLDPRLLLVVLHNLPEALPGHAVAADVHEQGLFFWGGDHLRPHKGDVFVQGLDGGAVHRDEPLLVSAVAADDAGAQVHIVDVQVNQLTDPDACGVEQLQHGPVPVALGVHALGLFQQQLHFLAGQDLRQLLGALVRHQTQRRVGLYQLLDAEVRIQTLDRRYASGHRGNRFAVGAQHPYVAAQVILVSVNDPVLRVLLKILSQLPDISQI